MRWLLCGQGGRPDGALVAARLVGSPLIDQLAYVDEFRWAQRTFERAGPGFTDPSIEVFGQIPGGLLGPLLADSVRQLLALLPEPELERQAETQVEILAGNTFLDPPIWIVRAAWTPERLSGARQVVELTTLLRFADLPVDPRLVRAAMKPAIARLPRHSSMLRRAAVGVRRAYLTAAVGGA